MLPTQTDVLIVGAGPTGLALAIVLQHAGIRYLLIEKQESGHNTSRAVVIHAQSLEIMEEFGVTQELVRQGLRVSKVAIRDRDRPLLRVRLDGLPSAYPYMIMIPQNVTETILGERLTALGGSIHRGVTATACDQDADGANVKVATGDGESVVRARYVVGADGMHSLVRTSAGIAFEGGTYEESFVLADVRMRWFLEPDENSLFLSPAGPVLVVPLPGGSFRVVAMLADPPERPSKQDVQRLLDTRGPTGGVNLVEDVIWSSRFRIHHRVVDSYRNGRMLLMGDAAHVHSPAGGQGMNTGIIDAVVLGQLLAKVLRDGQPDATLDTYGTLRRPAAVEVLALAGRLTRMAILQSAPSRMLRNSLLRVLGSLPPARRYLAMNLSGLSRKALSRIE